MTAMIQADTTSAKQNSTKPRAWGTIALVLLAHVAVLAALATMKPITLKMPETPKPVEVRFIQLEQPKPKPPEPKPPKPEPKPKPKEVNVVKQQPKPLPKPKPVLATPTVSERPQPVIAPQPEPLPEPIKPVVPEPAPVPQPVAKPEPKPQPAVSSEPKVVDGVSYIRRPNLSLTESEYRRITGPVKVKIWIGTTGKVENVELINSCGNSTVDKRVIREMKRALFTPSRENGVPVVAINYQVFDFKPPSN